MVKSVEQNRGASVLDDNTKIAIFKAAAIAASTCALVFLVGVSYSQLAQAKIDNQRQDDELKEMRQVKTDVAVIRAILEAKNQGK